MKYTGAFYQKLSQRYFKAKKGSMEEGVEIFGDELFKFLAYSNSVLVRLDYAEQKRISDLNFENSLPSETNTDIPTIFV